MALLGGVLALSPVADYDLWWHIVNGEVLLRDGSFPAGDQFSHTATGRHDVLYSWLFDLGAALAARGLGIGLLPLVQAALGCGCLVLLYLAGGVLGLGPAPRALGLAAVAPILRFHLVLRPHLVSYLCVSALVLLLALHAVRSRRWTAVAVVALLWLWRQVHASYPLGLVVLGLYALFPRILRTDPGTRRWPLALALGAGSLAFVLPPLGWEGTLWIVETLRLLAASGGLVTEWAPPTAFRTGFEMYWGYTLVSLLGLLLARRARTPFVVAVYVLTSLMALSSIRHICTFVLLTIVPVTAAWSDVFERLLRGWSEAARRMSLAAGVAGASTLCLGAGLVGAYPPFGLGVAENAFPAGVARFIEQHEVRGRMYNTHRLGGYLIWRLGHAGAPEGAGRRVFWDGRLLLYGDLFRSIASALGEPQPRAAMDRLLGSLEVDYAVMDYRDEHPLARHLRGHPGWALVEWDDSAMLLVRRASALERLLPLEVKAVRPWDRRLGFLDPDSAEAPRARAELMRKLAEDPGCARATAMYGTMLVSVGKPEAAAGLLSRFLRRQRESEWVRLVLGQALLAAGKRQDAVEALEPLRWSRRSRAAVEELLGTQRPGGLTPGPSARQDPIPERP